MTQRQTDEGAAGRGIGMGGTLAGQVGEKQETLTSGCDL